VSAHLMLTVNSQIPKSSILLNGQMMGMTAMKIQTTPPQTNDYSVTVKIQNGRVREAMEMAGIRNAAALAKLAGVSPNVIGELLNFKRSAKCKNGHFREYVIRIAGILGRLPEDLFPDSLNKKATNVFHRYASESTLRAMVSPVNVIEQLELREDMEKALSMVSQPRSRKMLELRAVDGLTFREIGAMFGITPARTQQLVRRAVWQIRRGCRRLQLIDEGR